MFHFARTCSPPREDRRFVSQGQRIHFARAEQQQGPSPFRKMTEGFISLSQGPTVHVARAGGSSRKSRRFMLPRPALHFAFARMKEKDISCQKFCRRNRRSIIFANITRPNLVPLVNQRERVTNFLNICPLRLKKNLPL